MERLGDILEKNSTLRTTSKGAMGISSVGKDNSPTSPALEESACPICKGAGFVYSKAPLGHPDYGKAVPCGCSSESKEEKQERLARNSNLAGLERFTFDNLIPEGKSLEHNNQLLFKKALEVAREYAQNTDGWLVFLGPSGCGKTHLAAAIANERLKGSGSAYFITAANLLDHLRSAFNPGSPTSYDALFEQIKKVPLLILDDLGTNFYTPWAQEKLLQILEYRYVARLPLIVTSTLTLEEMDEKIRTRFSDPSISLVLTLEEGMPYLLSQINGSELPLIKNMSFENFDAEAIHLTSDQRTSLQEAYRLAKQFAQSPEDWLVFLGGNGCGKTHLAAAIANYRKRLGQPVLFIVVPDLLDLLRSALSTESNLAYELMEKLKKEPLLILDDFGTEAITAWSQEKLYQLINYRYNARLPTIITSYFNLDQIEPRFASRLGDSRLSTVIAITAPDYRIDRPRQSEQRSFKGHRWQKKPY